MTDERVEVALPDLGRWVAVALLVLGGLVLFFWFARETGGLVEVAGGGEVAGRGSRVASVQVSEVVLGNSPPATRDPGLATQ